MPDPSENVFAKDIATLSAALEVDLEQGLTKEEVKKRQNKYGANQLEKQKSKNLLLIFLEQFLDPIIYVLIAATILAFVFGETIEGIAIVAVIFITTLIGFFMEWRATRSMESLQKIAQTISQVLRDGKKQKIKAHEIVPGDILVLEMGDVVTADARLFSHENLGVKEAALTGESTLIDKQTAALPADTPLAERTNMVFKGTLVSRGTAKALVTATGQDTELGKISQLTSDIEDESTPLEKNLSRLSKRLIWLTLILAAIIAVTGIIQGKELVLMIETAIALAIAAIPEGLPIVATIALARGMLRLAKKDVIIKKLEAVQTLGETKIICTDKTGTLTENQMTAHTLALPDADILLSKQADQVMEMESCQKLLTVGVLCNNATKKDKEWEGDPIEVALLELAQRFDYQPEALRNRYPEAWEIPFDSESKIMATVNEVDDTYWVCVKGALETVLDACTHVYSAEQENRPLEERDRWQDKIDELGKAGLRSLAFAYRPTPKIPAENEIFSSLIFLGIIGFIDPPRKDVKGAIEICHQAGIRVVMVTGDHPQTARNIAIETGLMPADAPDSKVVTGRELASIPEKSEAEQADLLDTYVFARVTPSQKLDLVTLYQKHNYTVGMTGDGVNDAPALKKANIGIAMGIRGTEAAKEVADVILRNDQFTAIELAIRQGRVIFGNIRKFVVYLLSSNLAEIISVAIASLTNLPLPLLPLQILYLNLVTDVFPSLALGISEGEKGIMQQPPRDPQEPIMPRKFWITTIVYGLGITAGVMGITFYAHYALDISDQKVNNMAFYTLVLAQLLNVFNLPERSISFFRNEITQNIWVWGAIGLCIVLTALGYFIPALREALSLVPLNSQELGLVVAFAFGALALTQLVKRLGGTV